MRTKPFGSPNRTVSVLGLGLAALGRPGYINLGHAQDLKQNYGVAAMTTHTHAVLDAAWEAGITYFDAARSYGRAEAFLGNWLERRQLDPAEVTVGSKWGYTYTADWQVEADKHEVKEHSLAVLQRQTAESTALLGRYLNLYQVHSATLDSGILENDAVLNELARLKATGWLIGLSLSGPKQGETLRRALEIERDGRPLFGEVQATWNLLEPSAGSALAEAHEAGWVVIVKEAVANGRLTPRNNTPEFAAQFRQLQTVARQKNCTIDALALAAVLGQPWATVVLSGAATVSQLQSNLGALAVAWDDETSNALASLAESPADYWQKRSNLNWN